MPIGSIAYNALILKFTSNVPQLLINVCQTSAFWQTYVLLFYYYWPVAILLNFKNDRNLILVLTCQIHFLTLIVDKMRLRLDFKRFFISRTGFQMFKFWSHDGSSLNASIFYAFIMWRYEYNNKNLIIIRYEQSSKWLLCSDYNYIFEQNIIEQ